MPDIQFFTSLVGINAQIHAGKVAISYMFSSRNYKSCSLIIKTIKTQIKAS